MDWMVTSSIPLEAKWVTDRKLWIPHRVIWLKSYRMKPTSRRYSWLHFDIFWMYLNVRWLFLCWYFPSVKRCLTDWCRRAFFITHYKVKSMPNSMEARSIEHTQNSFWFLLHFLPFLFVQFLFIFRMENGKKGSIWCFLYLDVIDGQWFADAIGSQYRIGAVQKPLLCISFGGSCQFVYTKPWNVSWNS